VVLTTKLGPALLVSRTLENVQGLFYKNMTVLVCTVCATRRGDGVRCGGLEKMRWVRCETDYGRRDVTGQNLPADYVFS
jgi:hypothetical protein